MTQWFTQKIDSYAHAYPDDDEVEIAYCGNQLIFECDDCGSNLDVYGEGKKARCPVCVKRAEAMASTDAQTADKGEGER